MHARFGLMAFVAAPLALASPLFGQAAAPDEAPQITAAERAAVREARQQMLREPRRLIFNSDGNETLLAKEPTQQAFLDARLAGVVGTQVDTLFYCPFSTGLAMFTHRTQIGEVLASREKQLKNNLTAEFLEKGLDPLQLAIDFGASQEMPVFFSLRMNDTHDAVHTLEEPNPLFPKWKEEHPEYLFGAIQEPMKFGKWSAHDYGHPDVRERVYRVLEEACRNFEVDGIELDYFRHTQLFRRVAKTGEGATAAELEQMTDLMRRIRDMTEREAVRRGGQPYLIAVRVPDSVEACRWLGIDLERWLEEGLVDVMVATGYFQFNPWPVSVELAHRHGVKVYAGMEKPRIFPSRQMPKEQRARGKYEPLRFSQQTFRARAAEAWHAGVDGIYLFNEYNPANAPHLHEVGNPETLVGLDKHYFATYLGSRSASFWFRDGASYFTRPTVEPGTPIELAPGERASSELVIGDDLSAVPADNSPGVWLRVQVESLADADTVAVALNGETLSNARQSGDLLIFELAPQALRLGANRVDLSLPEGAAKPRRVQDLQVVIDYPRDTTPWHELVRPTLDRDVDDE